MKKYEKKRKKNCQPGDPFWWITKRYVYGNGQNAWLDKRDRKKDEHENNHCSSLSLQQTTLDDANIGPERSRNKIWHNKKRKKMAKTKKKREKYFKKKEK